MEGYLLSSIITNIILLFIIIINQRTYTKLFNENDRLIYKNKVLKHNLTIVSRLF